MHVHACVRECGVPEASRHMSSRSASSAKQQDYIRASTFGNGHVSLEVLELLHAFHIKSAGSGLSLLLLYEGHLSHVLLQILLLHHSKFMVTTVPCTTCQAPH